MSACKQYRMNICACFDLFYSLYLKLHIKKKKPLTFVLELHACFALASHAMLWSSLLGALLFQLEYPRMFHCLLGAHPNCRIPSRQTARQLFHESTYKFHFRIKIKQKQDSYSMHRDTKSMKLVSLVLSIWASDREPTRLFLNSLEFRLRGIFLESKNNLRLDASASMCAGGRSITSMIMANCSASFSPGKMG